MSSSAHSPLIQGIGRKCFHSIWPDTHCRKPIPSKKLSDCATRRKRRANTPSGVKLSLEKQNQFAELRLRCEIKAGRLLIALGIGRGRPAKKKSHRVTFLQDLRISKNQSSRWQQQGARARRVTGAIPPHGVSERRRDYGARLSTPRTTASCLTRIGSCDKRECGSTK